jgi:putative ABC transport system ATP-binding protein
MNQPLQATEQTSVIEAHNISRDFRTGHGVVNVLRNISLMIKQGEFVALQGRSGSGKSTLLNILASFDNPTQGEVIILGQQLASMNEDRRAALRREHIGLLFQNAHLLPTLTAQENVEIALRLQSVPARERTERALAVLSQVGLSARASHRGTELSGGEQQRVALARALVHRPRFIIADEPTGNLDSQTARNMIQLMRNIASQSGVSFLIATHDHLLANSADRVLRIQDGQLA